MTGSHFVGGPLDGGFFDDLPGPIAGIAFAYYNLEAREMHSSLAGMGLDPALGPAVNLQTFEVLTRTIASGAAHYGIDVRALLDAAGDRPVQENYVHPSLRAGRTGASS